MLTAMVTDVIKWHRGPPALKHQIQNHQNMDRLSVCRIILLQRTPKLGRTKPSTGPHAARGPRVGHSWSKLNTALDFVELQYLRDGL